MPPANSRRNSFSRSPPLVAEPLSYRPQTPPSYLSALSEIESPPLGGLNLAATLSTQAEEDIDAVNEANISFLRTPIDPQDEWRAQNAAAAQGETLEEALSVRRRMQERGTDPRAEDRARRERLQRVLQRLNRMNDSAYSDRVPVQNSLHDWAPASDGNDDDYEEQLDEILHELRQQQPNTHPEILRVLGRSQLDAERESSRNRISASRLFSTHPSELSSLRSAAILQSVRRHPRFSARSRDYMQRYIMDRERIGHESESRERFSSSRLSGTSLEDRRFEFARSAWQSQRSSDSHSTFQGESRTREHRRGYEDSVNSASSSSPWLQQAITYIARLRACASHEESLSHASDGGLIPKGFFSDSDDDFIVDISAMPRPAPTSWLASGMVFSGSQHATATASTIAPAHASSSTTTRYLFRNNESLTSTTFDSRPQTFDPSRPWLSHTASPPHTYGDSDTSPLPSHHLDNWPVKVTIHAVDYDTMTLAATMEAYNVPSQPPSYTRIISSANNPSSSPSASGDPGHPRMSSITTYLEGEILDFRTHSFLTESFKSNTATDATYWRKLEPFAALSTDELVHKLVSRRFQAELAEKYVLMRWKERCFVRPNARGRAEGEVWRRDEEMELAEDGCGLTISGFYYVCLRRGDGAVEGLYYDPQSSPYQHLKLRPAGRGLFPAWQFR